MSRKKDANKYWIYGEDAALAAQFTAYLATVLKNRRLTYIRHLKKIQKVECSYEYAAETIEHVDSIREESLESAVEAKLMWEAIKPYLHKLSPKECEVMICLYIDRLSIADTATKLKIKPDTVSTHKHNTPHPNMLFSNYLEFWLQWKRKSWEEVTYSGYCQNVRSWIAPYFSARKVRLNEITVLDIEMFYTHEINKRGVSGNTVLHYHANIRKALSDAVKLKLIPYNPAAEVERPKKDNFVASYYSADELMEVLPIFANTKMELPVMLAAFYGLRRSEVIGLQWSAIDFERKIVTISRTFERINVDGKMVDVSKCRTKNKSSFRSLPLIPAVEQALLKAQKRQRQQMKLCGNSYCKEYKDYICVDDMGHLVTPDYVTRVFREMLLKNGFRPIRYHDLRHSCASLLIKNKVTMKEVQMWLGHSSFSTTANIYAHIDVDSKMEAANMIASKINLGELPEKKKSPKRKIA